MTTTETTIHLNSWTGRNGQRRRYVADVPALIDLKVERYSTGSIRFAHLNGEMISNTAAGGLMLLKVWVDDNDEVHLDGWTDRGAVSLDRDRIVATVKAALR